MSDLQEWEVVYQGQGVSPGVAYGPAYLITPDAVRVPRRTIEAEEVEAELKRLEDAISATRMDIGRVKSVLERADKSDEAAIFDSYLLILLKLSLKSTVVSSTRSGPASSRTG